MDVLVYLCERHGEVVAADAILEACWGNAIQGDHAVHKVLSQLRQALGDSATAPLYIETIRKRGYRAIASLEAEASAAQQPSWLHASPFPGLEAFQPDQAAVFFGRKLATARLDAVLRRQREGGCGLVLLLGASGSGKTSLVQAGLLPRLLADPPQGVPVVDALTLDCADLAGLAPFEALASVLLDLERDGVPVFAGESAVSLGRRLADDLAQVVAQLEARLDTGRLFLFIDRLEAVFGLSILDEERRAAFITAVEQLACSAQLLMVIACRNDFYPALMAHPALNRMKMRGAHVDLEPPDVTEIAQIIRLPAQAAGLRFEIDGDSGSGLDELLCRAAGVGADMLPLLAYCLHELYQRRSADGLLSLAVFREIGGVDGAIGARAEQVVAALGQAEVDALPRVLSCLVHVPDHAGPVTPRRATWSSLRPGPEQQLARALIDARLFVSDLVGGIATYGVAHEAVLRRWPRAVEWIDTHRQALALHARVSAQARRWLAQNKASDLLLPPGSQAGEATALLDMADLNLVPLEREFILASRRRARRAKRLRMAVSLLLLALALLTSALGLAAHAAQRQAERHRTEAEGLMAYMLGEFVDKVRPLGRLDLLDSISARALTYLSDLEERKTDQVALTQRSQALQLIAEVRIARGDPLGARRALLAARRILVQQLGNLPRNRDVLANLGVNAFWLGQIAFDQNDWPEAQRQFEEYRRDSDRLSALAPDDATAWIEQSYAHNSLGSVALKRGAIGTAAAEFALSVELKRRALAQKPDDQALLADLADSLSWLASAKEQLGELDAAMALCTREQALLLPLHQSTPRNGTWSHRYALALWHQAELLLALGRTGAGTVALEEAGHLLRELVQHDPSNRTWQMDADNVQLRLIELDDDRAHAPAGLQRLGALRADLAELLGLEPQKTGLARLAASTLADQAALHARLAQWPAARAALAPALLDLERLHAQAGGDARLRDALVGARLLEAAIAQASDDRQGAVQACARVRDILVAHVTGSSDFHVLAAWVRAHNCLGMAAVARPQQQKLAAIGYRDKAYLQAISSTPH